MDDTLTGLQKRSAMRKLNTLAIPSLRLVQHTACFINSICFRKFSYRQLLLFLSPASIIVSTAETSTFK